jgi:signal transduction histidine kinase
LGLSIVKRMVEDRDGSISIVSNPEKSSGTEFVFDWPIDYTLSTQKIAA